MSFSPPAGNIEVSSLLHIRQVREGHQSTRAFLSPHYNFKRPRYIAVGSTSTQCQIIRSARKISVDIGGPGVCDVKMHREVAAEDCTCVVQSRREKILANLHELSALCIHCRINHIVMGWPGWVLCEVTSEQTTISRPYPRLFDFRLA
jgi:hypothetical protein